MTAGQGARPGEDAAGRAEGGREAGRETRPLVTFALFAYNQEAFIREAVEGAFAQTYSPLEIILSDDCSSDRTFQIMQDMAAAYRGPHRVVVRQSPKNRRLMGHINDVVAVAQGGIIVMAAGDDVSYSDRVEILFREFSEHQNVFAVFSAYVEMDTDQHQNYFIRSNQTLGAIEHALNLGGVGLGATYAYRRECFLLPKPISESLKLEDRILPLRASVMGRVRFVARPTVYYRVTRDASPDKERKTLEMHISNQGEHIEFLRSDIRDFLKTNRISSVSARFLEWVILVSFWQQRGKNQAEWRFSKALVSKISVTALRIARKTSRIYNNSKFVSD